MESSRDNILLIPGMLCSELLWSPQIQVLSSFANVYIADHSSHDDIKKIAETILTRISDDFSVAGFSYGGFLVFELLRQAPERIKKVILLNTKANAADPEFEIPLFGKLVKRAAVEGIEAVVKELMPLLVAGPVVTNSDIYNTIIKMASATGYSRYKNQTCALLGRPDSRAELPEIRCPVLVIGGDRDLMTPPEQQEDIAAQTVVSRLEILEGCGHLSTLEKPYQVTELMCEWLTK